MPAQSAATGIINEAGAGAILKGALLTTNSIRYNVITDFQRLSNGIFTLRFYGEPGTNYVVQASTNLVDWLTLTNFLRYDGVFRYDDADAGSLGRRFYRAVGP